MQQITQGFGHCSDATLPPIIMEMENGPQKETRLKSSTKGPHFPLNHDYGRKGRSLRLVLGRCFLVLDSIHLPFNLVV